MHKILIPVKLFEYNLHKFFNILKPFPFSLTFFITSKCNSLCKYCNIGRIYLTNPEIANDDLKLEEYLTIFRKIGKNKIFWSNITGGEPFMREDFAKIISEMSKILRVNIITIATNATLPKKIENDIKYILSNSPEATKFIINVSLDGIGKKHDETRGFEGNFDRAIETCKIVKNLKERYDNLFLGINTLISKFDLDELKDTLNFIETKIKPDNFFCELAEYRFTLHNFNLKFSPNKERVIEVFKLLLKNKKKKEKNDLIKLRDRLRYFYYKFLYKNEKYFNFEGLSNVYILPRGEVSLSQSVNTVIGNLRYNDYDLNKILFSLESRLKRKVLEKNYFTTCVNAFYINFFCNVKNLPKLLF
jgi:MoaA/NifB/PqqE/SkfB family radical SAM enzyme